MMQSSINANHSPADSFEWKPNTSSRSTILHYLSPWTGSVRTALSCRKCVMRIVSLSLSRLNDWTSLDWIGAVQRGFNRPHWSTRKKLVPSNFKGYTLFSQGLSMCDHARPVYTLHVLSLLTEWPHFSASLWIWGIEPGGNWRACTKTHRWQCRFD